MDVSGRMVACAASYIVCVALTPAAVGMPTLPRGLEESRPDYVVYMPQQASRVESDPAKRGDAYNDHFQVIWDEARRLYYAFWTQATCEGTNDMHVCFSKSVDKGLTWTPPRVLAGSERNADPKPRAVWQQPMLAKSGRLYCLWNQQTTPHRLHHGEMRGAFSDDDGETWSAPEKVPMPRQLRDPQDPSIPPSWCNWQRPLRLGKDGRFFVGCTRRGTDPKEGHTSTKIEFWEFENIDDDPAPGGIRFGVYAAGRDSLALPIGDLDRYLAEEAGVVKLPDGRLFALMRTRARHPFWSQSRDAGRTWSKPAPLVGPDGRPYLHPCSPCPIYDLNGCEAASGEYFALIHNAYDDSIPPLGRQRRGPLYLIRGRFAPDADQPIAFGEPELFSSVKDGNSYYSSYTVADGEGILWFAHRKHYLVGRRMVDLRRAGPKEVPPAPRNPFRALTPDAERSLAQSVAAGAAWRPRTGRVRFFPRAQVKYRAESDIYLHRWYERPLFQNSAWQGAAVNDGGLRPQSWAKTVEMVKLGMMDGIAACATQSGRTAIVPSSERPDARLTLLWELPYAGFDKGFESYLDAAERALASPTSFRIDGKVVLTRYPGIPPSSPVLDTFERLRAELRARHGDRFIVMAYGMFGEPGDLPRRGPIDAAALDRVREHVRTFLRKTDGYLYCGFGQVYAKRYNAAFFDGVVVPLLRGVMMEPEFAGRKYLGLNMTGGHENTYHFAYSMDSTATRYLRESLESAVRLNPDFAICCEWDEQNENTFFRPVVSSGLAVQRIFRHYAARLDGTPAAPIPGDDTSIPNLAVSYRKALVAGEPLEVEVLNVPDGTFAGETFAVSLALRDCAGKVVRTFPSRTLAADSCEAVWFKDLASEFADAGTLSPELTVTAHGFSRTFAAGLWPIEVRALRNADHKWVRQPLRDVAWRVEGSLALAERLPDGTCVLQADVSSPVPFVSVEVMDGPDTVHFHTSAPSADAKGRARIRIAAQGTAASDTRCIEHIYNRPLSGTIPFDFGHGLTGTVSVAKVAAEGAVGFAAPGGFAAVASRWQSQKGIPPPCGGTNASFRVRVDPLGPSSVFRLRVVDAEHRVWCSAPVSAFVPSGKRRRIRVFERDVQGVSDVEVDAARVPTLVYAPPSGSGMVLKSGGGRDTWGMLGGGASLVTGIGMGESAYGHVLAGRIGPDTPGFGDTAPQVETGADGVRAIVFGGCRFGTLPMPALPSFAGFMLEMEVFPTDDTRRQGLLCADQSGIRLMLEPGLVPTAVFAFGNDVVHRQVRDTAVKGPPLRKDAWNRVRVRFDQRRAWIETDGRPGAKVDCAGYQWNQGHSVLGAMPDGKGFFSGRLGTIRIDCGL